VKIVSVHDAKTHLSRLIEEALAGEEIVIARGNEPVVRLVLMEAVRPQRAVGWAKGQIRIAEDFDEPIDDLADFR